MKKSMAGQGVAGALLLTGLMVSAGAMAASGDPVTGGSGTVTINVPIVTSTCSVSIPTEVNLDPVNKNSLPSGTSIEGKNFDTVFSNCKDKTLQMSVQASNPMGIGIFAYFDSGDPDHVFYYYIQPPQDAEITGGGIRPPLLDYLSLIILILCLLSPAAIIIPCRQKLAWYTNRAAWLTLVLH
ncbi:type 1 fimbrial protein [Salmonella enterica subsp. enterica serovar Weslaco]|uniref:Type 1 fimbrial protein n=1 Tax=Salmonella enterica subsp. enterica serovar Weslaco TaxID=1243597 RepID=A0A5X3P716_SALET|nr:type 1 fimbrial protein [Salmonella enterica subsp. enterica serovar Weslaco]EBZ6053866.1 type 1 fimbrial protein [Salmonella enterica subsp. enterica serovar Weslaco]EBZ6062568.1 type 1 fimbrial protein [Salmonella enterica subsp. enterica serovar Weslaco]EBZ6072402.1 type 1 fimbrial protein [Salmonella enterica subsp. enterica serovar Weslaco]